MIELKPCPFCGSRGAMFVRDEKPFDYGGRIRCENCGAEGVTCFSDEGPFDKLLEINKAMAAEHWNRRHR